METITKTTATQPTWHTVFFKNGDEIINNGSRFDTFENLQKDFPTAAIVPQNNVPEKWKKFSVVDTELVEATAHEIEVRTAIETAEIQAEIRKERDKLIAETDYLVMPDYPISEEERSIVLEYRQSLRDITLQDSFEVGIVEFPVNPLFQEMKGFGG